MGDLDLIPGLGRSLGGEHGNPLQYSCLESPHEQRSLVGYSPWGCKELDMTEQLSTAQNACGYKENVTAGGKKREIFKRYLKETYLNITKGNLQRIKKG